MEGITTPAPISIQIHSDGKLLGEFKENKGLLTFEGNVDEAGKKFVDFVCETFTCRINDLQRENNPRYFYGQPIPTITLDNLWENKHTILSIYRYYGRWVGDKLEKFINGDDRRKFIHTILSDYRWAHNHLNIYPKYDDVSNFEGVKCSHVRHACVKKHDKWGLINNKGELVLLIEYQFKDDSCVEFVLEQMLKEYHRKCTKGDGYDAL